MQSMPDGGFIDINIINCQPDVQLPQTLTGSRFVRFAVRDYGTGISRDNLARIFDPYFTTKEVGNGLGLAICYSIIKKHGGSITVESEPGQGSIFYVYLPALALEQPAELELDKDMEGEQQGMGRRLLVMDDEEMVCSVLSNSLKYLGYASDCARDGAEALQMYTRAMEQGRSYDAVIMDLTVPGGMGGQEAVKKLLEIDPSALAIVSSGYSSHEIMAEYGRYGFAGVVVKPFRIDDLSRVLNKVLAEE
jgi:CheY-like chemotaxis protein